MLCFFVGKKIYLFNLGLNLQIEFQISQQPLLDISVRSVSLPLARSKYRVFGHLTLSVPQENTPHIR